MKMIKKRKMNNGKNGLESESIKGKMKEILSISFFTLIAAFMALLLADLIFFPLAYFSVRNVDIFNFLFKYTAVFFIAAALLTLLFIKVRSLRRDGKNLRSIIIYIFVRPFQYFIFFIFVLLLIALLIAVIYFIFSSNYYHLHRIAGGA